MKELSSIFRRKFELVETACGFLTEKDETDAVIELNAYRNSWIGKTLKGRVDEFFHLIYFYWKLSRLGAQRAANFDVVLGHAGGTNADILLAHSCHRAAILQKLKAKQFRWIFNPVHYLVLLREWSTYKFGNFRKTVCISNSEARLISTLYRVDEERIEVIPNGVNLEKFKPAAWPLRSKLREEIGVPQSACLLLFVANEFERKGLKIAMDALSVATERGDDFRLVVVGAADPSRYVQYAHTLGIVDRCIFTGPRLDIPDLMSTADVVLVLSDYEPFGLVGVEAIACGTPVVATPVGGMLDYIVDKENGIFSLRNGQNVYEAVVACLKLFPKVESIEASLRHSVAAYAWKNIAESYVRLIEAVANTKNESQ